MQATQEVTNRIYQRGYIEMSPAAFKKLSKSMKFMTQFDVDVPFYCGYPVVKADATDNNIVRNGKKYPLIIKSRRVGEGQTRFI